MKEKYQYNLDKNSDKKVKSWGFTFLGDSNHSNPGKNFNNQDTQEASQLSAIDTHFILTQAKRGDRLYIVTNNAIDEMAHRLQKLGLLAGIELEVISNNPSGSVIIAVGNNHIGLGANLASKIIVSFQNFKPAANSLKI